MADEMADELADEELEGLIRYCGSRGGLMVSALGSGSGGPGSSLGHGAALCS